MKNILKIFRSDLRAIYKYFFVIVIVISMGVLPSLYALINIYANWDPYAGMKNVQVALASEDEGIKLKDGTRVNSADEIIDDVKDDKDIAYRPISDPEKAIEGVRSGKFYAAIIFEDGFTYDMHHFEEAVGQEQPRLTYYTNIKRNPITSKITDQVAEDILGDVNSKALRSMLTEYFGHEKDALEGIDTEEAVDAAIEQLTGTRDAVHDYNESITQIMAAKGEFATALKSARDRLDKGKSQGRSDIEAAEKGLENAKETVKEVSKTINEKTGELKKEIDDLAGQAKNLVKNPITDAAAEKALKKANRTLTLLQNLRSILPEKPKTTAVRISADAMDVMISSTERIVKMLTSDPSNSQIATDAEALKELLSDDMVPSLKLMLSDIENSLETTKPILKSAEGVLGDVEPVLDSAGSVSGSLDSSMEGLQGMLTSLEKKLDNIITKVEEAKGSEKANVLANLLGNTPEQYTDFFVNPVEIEETQFFKAESYGAAMTPFYTIIALWVGGVMLVTLMNCTVSRKKYPRITEAEGYFGRYLIFFLIGQIQAAVVVAGDIFLLGVTPAHPWLMWLSASVTSMVFVALIYAITLVFGDIGRALVVVIMFIQIAGSSGTYPIEILPGIFEKIYLFFPFPYAINAMRETICGMYENYFVIHLGQLMIFFLVAAALGILARKPFLGVKQYMQDKMKETEVM